MEIHKTDNYFSISPSEKEIHAKEDGFQIFYNAFLENNTNFKNINLILDFSEIINIDLNKILLFSQLS